MIDLGKFFKNVFNTSEISDDALKNFSQVHLQRLTANNPDNRYELLIDNTRGAYNDFNSSINTWSSADAQKQGTTIAMNMAKSAFISKIQQKEGIVRGTYGVGSAAYQAFFPFGLTEYDQMTLENSEKLMSRFVSACIANNGQLPPGFTAEFQSLKDTFVSSRNAQLEKMGEVEGLRTDVVNKRRVLEAQLMTNLLTIAVNNIGRPDVMNDYFDQSLIRRTSDNEEGRRKGTVAPGETKNIENTGIVDSSFIEIANTGATSLKFWRGSSGEGPAPADQGIILQPGEESRVVALNLGPSDAEFFNVTNLSTDTAGKWEADII